MIACVRCGSPVDQRAVFCGICGQSRVATPPTAPAPAAPVARAPLQPVIAILLGLIVVMAIAVAAFFIGRETTDPVPTVAAGAAPAQSGDAPAPLPAPSTAPPVATAAPAPAVRSDVVRARCTVIDDSGTPLNVRAAPNGRILGGLLYGHTVEVVEVSLSRNGRYWSRINANNPIYRSGWVLSALIDCETVGQ